MLLIINRFLFWIFVAVFTIDAYFILFHGGVPNIRTAPAIRKKIIKLLQDDCAAKKTESYRIIDLGSGNGAFTREIARALPQASVTGLEISKASLAWSRVMARKAGLKNLGYIKADFLTYDLSQGDAIVMYLLPSLMTPLGKKLAAETRPGTLITSNKFPLGAGWRPEQVLDIKTRYPHQRRLYIYRKE